MKLYVLNLFEISSIIDNIETCKIYIMLSFIKLNFTFEVTYESKIVLKWYNVSERSAIIVLDFKVALCENDVMTNNIYDKGRWP